MHSDEMIDLFFRRLTELRTLKNVSARNMSLELGQSAGYINNIENKRKFPSVIGLFYICEYFGLTPSEFFYESAENPLIDAEVIFKINQLSKEEMEFLIALVKFVVKFKGDNCEAEK